MAYDKAIASEPHTGSNLACPAGYITPAAIGRAAMLYRQAHNWRGDGEFLFKITKI